MLLNERDARRIADKALTFVKADDAAIRITSTEYSHLRFAANAFLTSGTNENVTVAITSWVGKRRGGASTNDLSDAALKAAVDQAETIARLSPVDVEYMPTLGRQTYRPTAAFADSTANISLTNRARQINDAIASSEQAGVVGAGFHQVELTAASRATKNGNFSYQRTSLVSLGMTARMPDGGSSGYFLRNHFDVG